ncbi:hypothetical protein ACFYSC_30265 [Streptosporangium sp. NPDC004379]|uniref:hypothetical protein n=1 Tax=Streptosporangium sp. NPDC004379 TaxID=3366189 RepID=UPI0036B6C6C0
MFTPDDLECRLTLPTAAARHDALRTREILAPPANEQVRRRGGGHRERDGAEAAAARALVGGTESQETAE